MQGYFRGYNYAEENMDFLKTGIIVKTENYSKCFDFYHNIIGLKLTEEKVENNFKLAQFEFGSSYLMVETGGKAYESGKGVGMNPCVIRFEVADIEKVKLAFKKHRVHINYNEFEWGKLVIVFDPDGNQVEFKE
ncbi:glyoxalase/bleomycin resistance/dioxygenase family protein [Vibrio alginolyticus]|nr:glyoxalase/bleomycin resistance/dioxygenase family protein [Vibrio alginolyticus]